MSDLIIVVRNFQSKISKFLIKVDERSFQQILRQKYDLNLAFDLYDWNQIESNYITLILCTPNRTNFSLQGNSHRKKKKKHIFMPKARQKRENELLIITLIPRSVFIIIS